ncbi:MAG: hypothetical protein RL333_627 [Pseudomonadota bacterium]
MRNRYIIVSALLAGFTLLSGQAFADRDGDNDDDCKSGLNKVRSVHSSRSNDRDNNKCSSSSSSNSGTLTRTKLKAYLTSTLQAGAFGKIEFETKTNSTKFESEVKIRVPSTVIGVADNAAAQVASVSLSLLRSGVEYASCDLDVKKAYTTRAEYKSEVASYRGAAPVARYGDCLDANGSVIVPAVQAGDAVEIFVDTYATGPFISGTVN